MAQKEEKKKNHENRGHFVPLHTNGQCTHSARTKMDLSEAPLITSYIVYLRNLRAILTNTYYYYLEERGFNTSKAGVINGAVVDTYEVYILVINKGGYAAVTRLGIWGSIASQVGVPHTSMAGRKMKELYLRMLSQFEDSEKMF